jgi:hypothetical protein
MNRTAAVIIFHILGKKGIDIKLDSNQPRPEIIKIIKYGMGKEIYVV